MELRTSPVGDLHLDPANARKHSKKNLEAIKASLVKFGQQKPIVVNDKGLVVAGNGTLIAARELGWTDIDTVITNLSKAELTAYAISDNRTAELAEWDPDVLPKLLKGLKDDEFDLASTGFDDNEINSMLAQLEREDRFTESLADSDDVQQQHEPRSELGEGKADQPDEKKGYFETLTPVIQYNIVFDNVDQQDVWYKFQRLLKGQYSDMETHAARLTAYIKEVLELHGGEAEEGNEVAGD